MRARVLWRGYRRRLGKKALSWLWGVTLVSLAAQARADGPSAEDRATARQFALEGYVALHAGDFGLAVDRFERADALVHAPTLVVDLARSYRGMGRLVEAHEAFQRVLREGVSKSAPTSWRRALTTAQQEDAQVEARLSWLTVRIEGPTAARVEIDGHALTEASLGAKRAIDPGRHRVVVEADGFIPTSQTLELQEGESSDLTLSLLRAPEQPKAAKPPSRPAPPRAPVETPAPSRAAAYAAFGVGSAGLVLSGVSTAFMLVARSHLEDKCAAGHCPPAAASDYSRYHLFGTLAPIGAGVGIVGGALGLYLLASGSSTSEAASYAVLPELSPRYIGVHGRF